MSSHKLTCGIYHRPESLWTAACPQQPDTPASALLAEPAPNLSTSTLADVPTFATGFDAVDSRSVWRPSSTQTSTPKHCAQVCARYLSVLLRLAGGHGPPILTLGPTTSSASLMLLIRRASDSRHSPTCSPRPRAKGRVCASCAGVARHMLTPRRNATRACCDAWRVGCRDGYVPAALPLTARMPAAAEPQSGPS